MVSLPVGSLFAFPDPTQPQTEVDAMSHVTNPALNLPAPSSPPRLLKIGHVGSAAVVNLPATHLGGKQAAALVSQLTELALRCRGRLVICLTEVSQCTAALLRALTDLARRCEVLGGRLVICGLEEVLVRLRNGLERRLCLAPTPAAAVELLESDS